eukprot:9730795-Heterocapsa_arctica.AAC.1
MRMPCGTTPRKPTSRRSLAIAAKAVAEEKALAIAARALVNWAKIWNIIKKRLQVLKVNLEHMGIYNIKALEDLGIDIERRGYIVRVVSRRIE